MLRKRIFSMVAVFAVVTLMAAACGTSSSGNTISGTIDDSGSMSTAFMNGLSAYSGGTIELRDSEGNVIDTDTLDEDGNFFFSSVDEGDYTIVLVDPDTGEDVTSLDVSLVDGDNVIISGTVSDTEATWEIEYEANDGLQNEDQNQNAINIASAAGVSVEEVLEMRESGMGWGAIANELGVHPSVLGAEHSFNPNKTTDVDDDDDSNNGNNGSNGCNEKNEDKNPNCSGDGGGDDAVDAD